MRLLAIDLGSKRTGIAVTDPLQIICTPFETVGTGHLLTWLTDYALKEPLEAIILGLPVTEQGKPSAMYSAAIGFGRKLRLAFPGLLLYAVDERYTTRMAHRVILASGIGKQARTDKTLADRISAAILLESFLEMRAGPGGVILFPT
jgi:putative holliday junction resolvase